MLITVFIVLCLSILFGVLTENSLLASAIIGLVLSLPILLVLKIILLVIPSGKNIILVCYDCGKESKM